MYKVNYTNSRVIEKHTVFINRRLTIKDSETGVSLAATVRWLFLLPFGVAADYRNKE